MLTGGLNMKIEITINTKKENNRPYIQATFWKKPEFYYLNGGEEDIVNCSLYIDKLMKDKNLSEYNEIINCINFCLDGVLNGTPLF